MSSDSSEILSLLNERSEIPSYLREPGYGRDGCNLPSINLPTNSTPAKATKYDPSHYHGSVEPWDLIAAQELDFFSGNIVKYVVRAGKKDGESVLDDLIKAQVYLKKLIEIRSHQ